MAAPKPKGKRKQPTPEELDERLSVPVPAEELAEGLLQAGPHSDDEKGEDGDQLR